MGPEEYRAETEGEGLAPFTLDDANEEKSCDTCEYQNSCGLLVSANKMHKQRTTKLGKEFKKIDDEFYCSIHKDALEDF